MPKLSVGICRRSIWVSSTNKPCLPQPPPPPSTTPTYHHLPAAVTSLPPSPHCHRHLIVMVNVWPLPPTFVTHNQHTPNDVATPHRNNTSAHQGMNDMARPRNDDGAACQWSPPDVLRRLTVTTHVFTVCIRFGCHITIRHGNNTTTTPLEYYHTTTPWPPITAMTRHRSLTVMQQ
ncbi:hypothetical protein K443DRAFT_8214 [Laccaria amethystina LaAM-08-1]|uniref:Uncharacterized protein n=1 Tax=Laccaria amethystina LaAM-08-1 TaxID=1095629 RepID=A0A0C9XQ20_9AGAR|nr:hypothetical protein K443DRAFT_8214 [Laccaria amethystina LaAM-08-1]